MKDVLYLVPDRELIEAARLAAEILEVAMLNRSQLLEFEEPERVRWDHFVDSVGGVTSERRRG